MLRRRHVIIIFLIGVLMFTFAQLYLVWETNESDDEIGSPINWRAPENITLSRIKIDPNRHVMVFFHMQKTSGTYFDQAFLEDVYVYNSAIKFWQNGCYSVLRPYKTQQLKPTIKNKTVLVRKFECKRGHGSNELWYFSENIAGWGWPCGLHPSLTDLKLCVESKFKGGRSRWDFYYISILREPKARFLSEFYHAKKTGSTWVFEDHEAKTKGQTCEKSYFSNCFGDGKKTWSWNMNIGTFVYCKWNLAYNRQTRMLAKYDLAFDVCTYLNADYQEDFDEELLERAKRGLRSLSFFGLAEYQRESRVLFERTFNNYFKFDKLPTQRLLRIDELILNAFDARMMKKIEAANFLDLRLYAYAVELFFDRLKAYNITVKTNKTIG